MSLRQRMEHQNKNNSSMLNNSGFEFDKPNREDQIYQKSRRDCEQQLYKRKSDLEYEKNNMAKIKEKQLRDALEKFDSDFEDYRKRIINTINQQLTQTKARFLAEIKQKRSAESKDQYTVKKDIDQLLQSIRQHLDGLKRDQYREYIAKIVTKDFDTPREQIKAAIRRLKYPPAQLIQDEKVYNCFRNDLQKMTQISLQVQSHEGGGYKPPKQDYQQPPPINLHENRDKFKNKYS